jgi:hypothetical protein
MKKHNAIIFEKDNIIQVIFIKQPRGWDVRTPHLEFWFGSLHEPTFKDANFYIEKDFQYVQQQLINNKTSHS